MVDVWHRINCYCSYKERRKYILLTKSCHWHVGNQLSEIVGKYPSWHWWQYPAHEISMIDLSKVNNKIFFYATMAMNGIYVWTYWVMTRYGMDIFFIRKRLRMNAWHCHVLCDFVELFLLIVNGLVLKMDNHIGFWDLQMS